MAPLGVHVQLALFGTSAKLRQVIPGVVPEAHRSGGQGADTAEVLVNPVGDDELDAVLVGVARRKQPPCPPDVTLGWNQADNGSNHGRGLPHSASPGHPDKYQAGRQENYEVEFRDQTVRLADHPKIKVLVADHIQSHQCEDSETEYGPG